MDACRTIAWLPAACKRNKDDWWLFFEVGLYSSADAHLSAERRENSHLQLGFSVGVYYLCLSGENLN